LSRKIAIRCKTCRNTLGTFEFNGYITFDYKCKKCKQRNTGVIREHKKKGEKDG
jgi:putative hydrogenase nickel insertion protein hypA